MSAADHEARARIEGVKRKLADDLWGLETKASRPVMFPEYLSPDYLRACQSSPVGLSAAAYMAAPV